SMPKNRYEIIVVDDASTDHSPEIIQSFAGFVRPVFNPENIGLGATCNRGLKMALGRFVIRVDADDYVHHDFLSVSELYMSQNYEFCDAVALDYLEVDENENVLGRKSQRDFPIACGIAFKMDTLVNIGLYDGTLRFSEETELMKRFLSQGCRMDYLPLPLYRYKKHSKSLTATNSR
ncbi:MAG: glycosyltransferase family A protein, partial [Proteobacteria bacterium]|nr:glycosyltransferase family A protein [Pseudomonadota bacterium]